MELSHEIKCVPNTFPSGCLHPLAATFLLLFGNTWVFSQSAQRCDLLTAPTECIELTALEGKTFTVPESVTRIHENGLNLCPKKSQQSSMVDLIFIVDQSGSMTPDAVWLSPDGSDTVFVHARSKSSRTDPGELPVKARCGEPNFSYKSMHDGRTITIPAYCDSNAPTSGIAGDPYETRGQAVRNAIDTLVSTNSRSTIGYIGFAETPAFLRPNVVGENSAGIDALKSSITMEWGAGTYYDLALEKARQWLSDPELMKNDQKAIIFISDGKPSGGSRWRDYRDMNFGSLDLQGNVIPSLDADGESIFPPVFGIYLGGDGADELELITQLTGGFFRSLPVKQTDDLASVVLEIVMSVTNSITATAGSLEAVAETGKTHSAASRNVRPATSGTVLALDNPVPLALGENRIRLNSHFGGSLNRDFTTSFTIRVTGNAAASSPWRMSCFDRGYLQARSGSDLDAPAILQLDPDRHEEFKVFAIVPELGLNNHPAIWENSRKKEEYRDSTTLRVSVYTATRGDEEKELTILPSEDAAFQGIFRADAHMGLSYDSPIAVLGNRIVELSPGDTLILEWKHPVDPRDVLRTRIGLPGPQMVDITGGWYEDSDADGFANRLVFELDPQDTLDITLIQKHASALSLPESWNASSWQLLGARLVADLEPNTRYVHGNQAISVNPISGSPEGFLAPGDYTLSDRIAPVLRSATFLEGVDGQEDTLRVVYSEEVAEQIENGSLGHSPFLLQTAQGQNYSLTLSEPQATHGPNHSFLVRSIQGVALPTPGDKIWISPEADLADPWGNTQNNAENTRIDLQVKLQLRTIPVRLAVYRDQNGDGNPDEVQVMLDTSGTALDKELLWKHWRTLDWPSGIEVREMRIAASDQLIFSIEAHAEKPLADMDNVLIVNPVNGLDKDGYLTPAKVPIGIGYGPVLVDVAQLGRYYPAMEASVSETGPDTLWVIFSREIQADRIQESLFLTAPKGKEAGLTVRVIPGTLQPDTKWKQGENSQWRRYRILVTAYESSRPVTEGDEIWIHPDGGIMDVLGNAQRHPQNSRVPIRIHPTPVQIRVAPLSPSGIATPDANADHMPGGARFALHGGVRCQDGIEGVNIGVVENLPPARDFGGESGAVDGFSILVNQPVSRIEWSVSSHLGEFVDKGYLRFRDPDVAFREEICFAQSGQGQLRAKLLVFPWNGNSHKETELGNGVYIYKVKVAFPNRETPPREFIFRAGRLL